MKTKTLLSNLIYFYTELYEGIAAPHRPLIRLGAAHDGGYLLPDDLDQCKYLFSPGVAETADFEMDCAQRYNMPVYMCDHTVESSPLQHPLFHFEKKGIGYGDKAVGLLQPLSEWISKSGIEDSGQLVLQMDIEGAEYDFFLSETPEFMKRFRYVILEIHYLHRMLGPKSFNKTLIPFIKKIKESFDIIHIHPNNHTVFAEFGSTSITSCLELTLSHKSISKRDRNLANKTPSIYPKHKLDSPNMPDKKDVDLPNLDVLKEFLRSKSSLFSFWQAGPIRFLL